MLGGDDDQRLGSRGLESFAQPLEARVEALTQARIRALRAPRDSGGVAASSREHETHVQARL